MFRTNLKHEKKTKGNNSLIMQKRVMVLVHCTSPCRALLMKFQADTFYNFCVMLRVKL